MRRISVAFIVVAFGLSALAWTGPVSVAHAVSHSAKVAYVTDFSTGVGDPNPLGSSIFVNAITGSPPAGGAYTTASGTVTQFTDVFVSTIDSGGVGALSGYDTVMLYEVCDFGSHTNLATALNTYLTNGLGKVVIYDADKCTSTPNYSTFMFPFTTNNPGPRGDLTGSITVVESESLPATLTRGISIGTNGGFPSTDAVGDSNTFSPSGQGWCSGIEGTNVNRVNGIQEGYLRTSAGGLVIYEGNDNWYTDSSSPQPNAYDKTIFDNILDQPFNPDNLPCAYPIPPGASCVALCAPGISDPANQWAPYGPDPSIHNLIMKFYGDDTSELNAFRTGQLDMIDTGQGGYGVPVSLWSAFESNPDWLITPKTGAQAAAALYHGIYYNLVASTWTNWGCDFAHGNSACGVEIRQAFAHLLDRAAFVRDGPLQGGGIALTDDVPQNKIDSAVRVGQVVASSHADQCSWDTLNGATLPSAIYPGSPANPINSGYGGCVTAFNLGNNPGGFAAAGSKDFCAAVDHLIMATRDAPALGLVRASSGTMDQFGHVCAIDPTSPGLATIAAHPMRAKVRSTNPRLTMGLGFASTINMLLAGTSASTIWIGSGSVLGKIVFFEPPVSPVDDWDWYTFGYQDTNLYPTTLFSAFHSQFASDLCGGPNAVEPNNPTFVCITAADTPLLNLATTLDPVVLYSQTYSALNVLGSHAVDLPGYSFVTRTAALRSVANPVETVGLAYENPWNFLISHKSSYVPVNPLFAFNGGGPSDTIRWGQAGGNIVSSLNPYISQWVWEFNILLEVYDSLFASNPVVPTQVFCWVCNNFDASFVDGSGNQHIRVELKQNLKWQDGVQLDARDVAFSILTERDFSAVLSGNVALVLGVKILDPGAAHPINLDVTMQGASIANPLNVGSTLLIPQHIWGSTDNGVTLVAPSFYDGTLANNFIPLKGVSSADPAKLDPSYDPVQAGTFIGSSTYQCRSTFLSDLGKLGTGCVSNSGTRGGSAISPGGSIALTSFDQWFDNTNPAWSTSGAVAGSGQYQEYSWADRYDNGTVTVRDLVAVGLCSGKSSSAGCTDYAYWNKDFTHPATPGTVSGEVTLVATHLDDAIISPFSWNGLQWQQAGSTLPNIVPFVYNCAPYNVASSQQPAQTGSYCAP